MLRLLTVIITVFFVSGASGDESPAFKNVNQLFGPLTLEQKLEDFHYIVSTLRNSYGPLHRKAETAKLNFEQHVKEAEEHIRKSHADGERDQEFFTVLSRFINRFQDSHLSFYRPDDREVTLGFGIGRVARDTNKKEFVAVIASIDRSVLPEKEYRIYLGDEVLTIDGKTPGAVAQELSPEINWSSPEAKEDLIYAYMARRPGFRFNIDRLLRHGPVTVEILDKDGVKQILHLHWVGSRISHRPALFVGPECADGYCLDVAAASNRVAFSVDAPEEKKATSLTALPPLISAIENCSLLSFDDLPGAKESSATREWEQTLMKQPPFLGAVGTCTLAVAKGKTSVKLGIVPVSSFSVNPLEAHQSLYRRLFSYMQENVHGLIVDARGNPGGNSDYLKYIVSLLTNKTIDMGTMTLPLSRYAYRQIGMRYAQAKEGTEDHARFLKMLRDFDDALASGKTHLEDTEFFGSRDVMPANEQGFKPFSKILFVLQDSFCASCGDWFPGALKANSRSINIGTNTIGAGGHTEVVGPLANSEAKLGTTFSLFKLSNGDFVEDKGVAPHHLIELTQSDYREGLKNKDGYRDRVLAIVKRELEQKVVLPQIQVQRKALDELSDALRDNQ